MGALRFFVLLVCLEREADDDDNGGAGAGAGASGSSDNNDDSADCLAEERVTLDDMRK